MTNLFKKASKKKAKLRCAIFGPSGSGKTYTSLQIATGIGGKIALIDTERGSASKYASKFSFDVAELEQPDIDNYVKFIESATDYDVLIIDSLSHGWQELLQEVEKIAQAKFRGNTWSAWSQGTPKQKRLVNAILSFPGHVMATIRSKTEWTMDTSNGKNRPVRVGLAPEQGKGIEYEFDILLEMSTDNIATILKDRTGKFQDKIIKKPGESFGKDLVEWLNEGEEEEKIPEKNIDLANKVKELYRNGAFTADTIANWLKKANAKGIEYMQPTTLQAIIDKYSVAIKAKAAKDKENEDVPF
jgi:hypothetical protein